MIRPHEDVDGCGCLRCQEVDHAVLRRSLAGAFYWSTMLPFARPSILFVLGGIGLLQLATLVVSPVLSVLLVALSVVGVFLGRGYIGVVAQGLLGHDTPSPASAFLVVLGRLPSFLGAVLVVVSGLAVLTVLSVSLVLPGLRLLVTWAGTDPLVADVGVLVGLAITVIYTLLKCCFVPEACFIGEYGPVEAVRVSWQITSIHRLKVVAILAGFAALLAVGSVLDTTLTGSGAPVALSFETDDTTIVLRSFGFSLTSGVRFLFDLAVTALYSGLFVHQYVDSSLGVNAR